MQGQGERTADLSDYADYADGWEEDRTEKTMLKKRAFWRFLGEIWKKRAFLEEEFRRSCVEIIAVFENKNSHH